MKIIFIFVDGLGIGCRDPAFNPLCRPQYAVLRELLGNAIPLDACLGIDGLPQSATGQAALLTGINAPQEMGRHIEGFPPAALRRLIKNHNLFSKLRRKGRRCTFANAYWIDDHLPIPIRRQSVTTVMSLAALKGLRRKTELLHGMAVYHDITRWTAHLRGYDGKLLDPETAADHLLALAEENDFTLFEYFLTDRAGHSGDPEQAARCLDTLERFLPKIVGFSEQPGHLFLLSSDHGNIEDLSTVRHTRNPVPFIALGDTAHRFRKMKSLIDVTPAIVECMT